MSKLRCRVGDIVVIIATENRGKLGTVIRMMTREEVALFPRDVLHWSVESLGAAFMVSNADDTERWADSHVLCNDADLRPLRDGPGQDEMLRITGKPKKIRPRKRQTVEQGVRNG